MHIITNPKRFDVILTENLFGDILSDEASVITGSLGMLGSATVGGAVDLYEPVHGSAPDIAGQGIANPLGAIASAAMLLRYSAALEGEATDIEEAIRSVLEAGYRTPDINHDDGASHLATTAEMGEAVCEALVGNCRDATCVSCRVRCQVSGIGCRVSGAECQASVLGCAVLPIWRGALPTPDT